MRRQCSSESESESGSALLAAVAVTLVAAMLSLTAVASVVVSSRASGVDRQRTQAVAAAEAGLDIALQQITATAIKGQEGSMPCTKAAAPLAAIPIASSPAPISVQNRISYVTPSGAACPVNGEQPTSATVISTATPTQVLAGPTSAGVRTMTTTVVLSPGAGTSRPTWGSAAFSDEDLDVTNDFSTIGGGTYTNGTYKCDSEVSIGGSVVAQGNAEMTNECTINGDLAVKGKFLCNSQSRVTGNVTASSTSESSLTNTCTIEKNLWTGGPIKTTTRPEIKGTATSSTGGFSAQTGVKVHGATRLGGTVNMIDGKPASGVFLGGVTQNSPQAVPPPPPGQTMPAMTYQPSDWAGYQFSSWSDWVKKNANDNSAESWSDARTKPCDQLSSASYSLKGPLRTSVDLVVDARACSEVKLNTVILELSGDLVLFVKDFTSTGGLTVTSKDGNQHTLSIIVPATNATDPCSAPGKNIRFNSGGTVLSDKTPLLLYTTGEVELTNTVDFFGAIYACKTKWSVAVTVRYLDVTPPGGAGGGWTKYTMESDPARYEVTG